MPTPKKRYLDSTPAVTKQRLAKINKQANARERNIAKAYLEAGPNIVNLAKAAYHWYNSVPWLGGKDENGNILVTGEVPTPGMRSPKSIAKGVRTITKANDAPTPIQLAETFIKQHKNTTKYARDIAEDIFGLNPNNQIVDYNAMYKYGKVFNKRIKRTLPLAEKRGTLRSNREPNVIVADGEGRHILYDRFINDTPILPNRKEVIHYGDPVTIKGKLAQKYYYMTRPAEGPFEANPSSFADRKNNTIVVIPRGGYKNMYKYTVPHEKAHIFIDGRKERTLFGDDIGLKAPKHSIGDTDITVDLYLSRPDEQLARGTQIKNYLGITDESPITPKQLKYAAKNYVKDTGNDNNMTEFFSMIEDYKKAAEWLSLAPSFTLPIIGGGIGYGLYKKSNKNKNIR